MVLRRQLCRPSFRPSEEGRIIYDNIRKFIKYLLSCNASEIAVMLIGPFLGMPLAAVASRSSG